MLDQLFIKMQQRFHSVFDVKSTLFICYLQFGVFVRTGYALKFLIKYSIISFTAYILVFFSVFGVAVINTTTSKKFFFPSKEAKMTGDEKIVIPNSVFSSNNPGKRCYLDKNTTFCAISHFFKFY